MAAGVLDEHVEPVVVDLDHPVDQFVGQELQEGDEEVHRAAVEEHCSFVVGFFGVLAEASVAEGSVALGGCAYSVEGEPVLLAHGLTHSSIAMIYITWPY